MLIGLYADPHFSQSSSIIVGRKGSFSGRLNNLIKSFEWMNNLFKERNVDHVICLGDLTDKPNLTAEEITALGMCGINDHYLIVGNHCRADKDGKINSLSTFDKVIYEPQTLFNDENGNPLVYILPYNSDQIDLSSIGHPKIILSHNDIKGYMFESRASESGYSVSDITKNCNLFINGHLHNGGWVVENKIMNLGILSGVNFSSCGTPGGWEPSVAILDTDTLNVELIENPLAYRFKKVSFDKLPKFKKYLDDLPDFQYVLQVKTTNELSPKIRKLLDSSPKVVASRIITINENKSVESDKFKEFEISTTSIYDKFRNFIKSDTKSKYDSKLVESIISEMEVKYND